MGKRYGAPEDHIKAFAIKQVLVDTYRLLLTIVRKEPNEKEKRVSRNHVRVKKAVRGRATVKKNNHRA